MKSTLFVNGQPAGDWKYGYSTFEGHADDCREREFPLERISGPQTVTFVFLPGSQFDFKWFQFKALR